MSSDDARYRAMVEFLGTFPTLSGAPPGDLSDLSDGVALFEVLSEIAPDYFDPTTIARHLGDNWALKSSNLRKLVRNLENYFKESLRKDAPDSFESLNVSEIARQADPAAISNLVELVAAAAVTCAERAEYVGRIMQMTPESQVEMKGIIERSLGRLSDYDNDGVHEEAEEEGGDENELVFGEGGNDEDDEFGAKSHLFAAGHNRKVTDAEKEQLEKDLQDTKRELASYKSQAGILAEDQEKSQKKLKALVEDLQDRLVIRQDELIDTEEELRTVTSELSDLKSKLAEVEEEKAALADDLDVANARVDQLRKAEATVVAYRKKLEGVGVMNQQMTDLEDQAANYLRQIMDLEAEVKKSATLQKSIDSLNQKVVKLEKEKSELSASLKSTGSDLANLKSRLNDAEGAKKMYESELADLRAQQINTPHDDDGLANIQGLDLNNADPAETKEKAMRLEIENKSLKEELEKLRGGGDSGGDPSALQAEIKRLKEELIKKEKENTKIGNDKDKLETYTKRTLAKFQDKYLVALQECKAKLKEKQDKIEALESRSVSEKTAQKREERLLSSTVYELGLAIMQHRLKDR